MAKKVTFDYCFFLEFHVFYANCFEYHIISFNHDAFVLGRKTQSYRVQRERDQEKDRALSKHRRNIESSIGDEGFWRIMFQNAPKPTQLHTTPFG